MPKARILIAEDEVITSMDLWHILQLWGYEMCEQVTSGEEAVVRAGADRPDVVLIDINLRGGISGIEAAFAEHDPDYGRK
ncbi:MAG: response regulator, partial [Thermodesulfovibrionales bacterium]